MGVKNYIVAIELGSSKIAGAVGVESIEGMNVIAYANEPVNGFISKGVVKNIDETSICLSSLINKLEGQLDEVSIKKAYVAIGGMSMKSVKSTVKIEFDEFTKITQNIIDDMAIENDNLFAVPEGYQKVQVITQEYKMGGDSSINPIGMSVRQIEGNYINIIIKEQFVKQLEESFNLADIEIAKSFSTAKINAEQILSDEEKRDGCALVDIGAETTTVSIFSNNIMRKLSVIPLGGYNITRDFSAEHISMADAETLKVHAGYNAERFESCIDKELRDNIIGARMAEILQNVNHQIKRSGENIACAVITGGGARLKNIETLFVENMPGLRTRIATEPLIEFNSSIEPKLRKGEISSTLYGLLKNGKEGCCQELPPTPPATMQDMFEEKQPEVKPVVEQSQPVVKEEEKAPIVVTATAPETKTITEEKEEKKAPEKKTEKEKSKSKGRTFGLIGDLFGNLGATLKQGAKDIIENATREEEDYNEEDNEL